ncbi:MAG: hypothetical protein R3C10_09300 [Pirellulales bacterium]
MHRFCRAMAQRFAGRVEAWEPWNEANVADFGAHTIDEICTYQKAAYLGLKAGDPNVTVCWNATTGVPTDRQTAGVLRNQTTPYFDTFNIHSYDWPTSYERLWGPVRQAAVGKPLWITESDRGMAKPTDGPAGAATMRGERLKAEFIAQSYALSLQAGAARHFHFVLGQYGERDVQFGLLHGDLTPRPAYVALATVGRMLSGARCLGRHVVAGQPDAFVIAFSAQPNVPSDNNVPPGNNAASGDGDAPCRDVLVVWAERPGDWSERGNRQIDWPLPDVLPVQWSCDYLGRRLPDTVPSKLTSAPTFLVLPAGASRALALNTPPRGAQPADAPNGTAPSPVVLQCCLPHDTAGRDESIPWAWEFEHRLAAAAEHDLPLFVYNFSDEHVSGAIAIENLPPNYRLTPQRWQVNLAPNQRQRLPARVHVTARDASAPKAEEWLTLRGDFGPAGRPTLALQLFTPPN